MSSTALALRGMGALRAYQQSQAFRRAQAALKVGRFIYNNRRKIKRAASTVKRFAKKMRFKSPPRISRSIGGGGRPSSVKRTNQFINDEVSRDTRVLYAINLTDIAQTSANASNFRQRNIILYKGFKLDLTFRNDNPNQLYLNVAVVVNRFDDGTPPNATGFYRADGTNGAANVNAREEDFAQSLTSLEFHNRAINQDRYRILMHKRYKLGAQQSNLAYNVAGYPVNFKKISHYMKVNQYLRYRDNETRPTTGNIWYIYWADVANAASGSLPLTDAYFHQTFIRAYFQEPKT